MVHAGQLHKGPQQQKGIKQSRSIGSGDLLKMLMDDCAPQMYWIVECSTEKQQI